MRVPFALTAATAAGLLALAGAAAPAQAQTDPEPGGTLTALIPEPTTLLPWHSTDPAADGVIRQVYSGLVDYDLDGRPVLDLAESITSFGGDQTWEITIRDGFVFHDGEPVDASTFALGWTEGAAGPHGHLFDRIAAVTEVDTRTLEVELTAPYAGFPTLLGHPAFYPMHPACAPDPALCDGEQLGNGPYQLDAFWEPGDEVIHLVRFDFYPPGEGKSFPDELLFEIDDPEHTICLPGDGPDLVFPFPPEGCVEWSPTIPLATFSDVGNTLAHLGMPRYAVPFDDPELGRAFSLAIDWEEIAFATDPRRVPAGSLVGPHIDGHRPDVCLDCRHDPAEAFQILEAAGLTPWPHGTIELWAPAGGGHEAWLSLVAADLEDALGIESTLRVDLPPGDYRDALENHELTGPFWFDWSPEYPAMDAYLEPLYTTGGRANYTGYLNPDIDALIAEGVLDSYQLAEEIVLEELPVIPMWFEPTDTAVYRLDRVDRFAWSTFRGPEYGLMGLFQS